MRASLQVEQLEDRITPAVAVTTQVGSILTVAPAVLTGSNPITIEVHGTGTAGEVVVTQPSAPDQTFEGVQTVRIKVSIDGDNVEAFNNLNLSGELRVQSKEGSDSVTIKGCTTNSFSFVDGKDGGHTVVAIDDSYFANTNIQVGDGDVNSPGAHDGTDAFNIQQSGDGGQTTLAGNVSFSKQGIHVGATVNLGLGSRSSDQVEFPGTNAATFHGFTVNQINSVFAVPPSIT